MILVDSLRWQIIKVQNLLFLIIIYLNWVYFSLIYNLLSFSLFCLQLIFVLKLLFLFVIFLSLSWYPIYCIASCTFHELTDSKWIKNFRLTFSTNKYPVQWLTLIHIITFTTYKYLSICLNHLL